MTEFDRWSGFDIWHCPEFCVETRLLTFFETLSSLPVPKDETDSFWCLVLGDRGPNVTFGFNQVGFDDFILSLNPLDCDCTVNFDSDLTESRLTRPGEFSLEARVAPWSDFTGFPRVRFDILGALGPCEEILAGFELRMLSLDFLLTFDNLD